MVKIVNASGDIKVGRQGEAVYQRKYGEQIRRTVSPKRAIPSEAQIAHRQVYRDALAWRSNLSLANRRYLEGYCIANGVVDDYHIPLPWSRFALKLYLQTVKFIVIKKGVAGSAEVKTKYESYETGDDVDGYIFAGYKLGQTFTPLVSHNITRLILKLWRKGTPTIIRVGIYLSDVSNRPIGDEFTGVDVDFSGITPTSPGEWVTIDLPPYPLALDIKYVIAMETEGGDINNRLNWREDMTSPTYTRGMYTYWTEEHGYWQGQPGVDHMFQEWEVIPGTPEIPGLLHVRHPALLTIVQKRDSLIVKGYDGLSSLDAEYLTKQVGLDVLFDDVIEATTLPGIECSYLVK